MLIQRLTGICADLDLALYFGGQDDFNLMADSHTDEMGTALFCEGFLDETWRRVGQGSGQDETVNIVLWLLQPSELSDEPDTELLTMQDCKTKAQDVLTELEGFYEVSTVTVKGIKKFTNRNFDGVRLTFGAVDFLRAGEVCPPANVKNVNAQ